MGLVIGDIQSISAINIFKKEIFLWIIWNDVRPQNKINATNVSNSKIWKWILKLTLSKNKQFIVKLGSIVLVCVIMLLKMLLLFFNIIAMEWKYYF